MPKLSSTVSSLRPSVFATLNEKIKKLPAPPIGLHIGDTFALPPEPALWQNLDLTSAEYYRYSHPFGTPEMLAAVAQKVREQNLIPATADWIQITCGATQALHCSLHALLEPGQGVLLLAPYWPLFGGMVRCLGGDAIEVECSPKLQARSEDLGEILQAAMRPHVKAVYFGNPNNPDGYVYTREQLQQLAAFAEKHDLWVFSDECYEHFLYDGREHVSVASLPGMQERTVSCFSFSKSFAMAGSRLGYSVATPTVSNQIRRFANHTVYNVSPAVQKAGVEMLKLAPSFCAQWLPFYARGRATMGEALQGWNPQTPPGGAYYFVDLGSPEKAWSFIDEALAGGVVVAPGAAFGDQYAHCVRICFTCVDELTLHKACGVLSGLGARARA